MRRTACGDYITRRYICARHRSRNHEPSVAAAERDAVAVQVADREFAPAVRRIVDVVDDVDLEVRERLAGELRGSRGELPLLDEAIQLVDAVGVEPQMDV